MLYPITGSSEERWMYVNDTELLFGNAIGDPVDQAAIDDLFAYAYSQNYTGLFLYDLHRFSFRLSGDVVFDATAIIKLQNFINQATILGIKVGGSTSTSIAHLKCFKDYQTNYATSSQKFHCIITENEWYQWGFSGPQRTSGNGEYTLLGMLANFDDPAIGPKGAQLKAIGIEVWIYYGWPAQLGYTYSGGTHNGSTVTGQKETDWMAGYFDRHCISGYRDWPKIIEYSIFTSRLLDLSYPMKVMFIIESNYAYQGNFLEGRNSGTVTNGAGTLLYAPKSLEDCWNWLIYSQPTSASLCGTAQSGYFNSASTAATIRSRINVVGLVMFKYTDVASKIIGNGPRILVDAGIDASVLLSDGSVTLGGSAQDDTYPSGSSLTHLWSVVSGPGGSSFTSGTTLTPDFNYVAAGVYVLRLTSTDGDTTWSDTMTVTVINTSNDYDIDFTSINPSSGVPITINIADTNGDQNGSTALTRNYIEGTVVVVTAPPTFNSAPFVRWYKDGVLYSYAPTITIVVDDAHVFQVGYSGSANPITHIVEVTSNVAFEPYSVDNQDLVGNPPLWPDGVMQDLLLYEQGSTIVFSFSSSSIIDPGRDFQGLYLNGVLQSVVTSGPNKEYTYVVPATNDIDVIYVEYDNPDSIMVVPHTKHWPCHNNSVGAYVGFQLFLPNRFGNNFTVRVVKNFNGLGTEPLADILHDFIPRPEVGSSIYTWSTVFPGIDYGFYISDNGINTGPGNPQATPTSLGPLQVWRPEEITANIPVTVADCLNPFPSAYVAVNSGTAPFTYFWANSRGVLANTIYFSSAPGLYQLTIRDANGCSKTIDVELSSISTIVLDSETIVQPTCASPNGSIDIVASGGTAPLVKSWTKNGVYFAGDVDSISSLDSGIYVLTINDSAGCSAIFGPWELLPVGAVDIILTATPAERVCSGQQVILSVDSVSINGSEVGYATIFWDDIGLGPAIRDLGILVPGTYIYSVTITTISGCIGIQTVSVNIESLPAPESIVVEVVTSPTACLDNTSEVKVSASQRQDFIDFGWQWNNGSTSPELLIPSILFLTNPTMEFWIIGQSEYGCPLESNHVTLTKPNAPALVASGIKVNTCTNASLGAITLTVTGGCPTYTYLWSGPSGFTATTKDLTGLASGAYSVVITDQIGQTKILSFSINTTVVSSIAAITNQLLCNGASNAGIVLTVSGGTAPYTYAWTKIGVGGFSETTKDISGLTAGTYQVVITDAVGCISTFQYVITELPVLAISINVHCPTGGVNGWGNAIVTGGTGSYIFSWKKNTVLIAGATSNVLLFTDYATYEVTVVDSNGCTASSEFICQEPPIIVVDPEDEDVIKERRQRKLLCCVGDYGYRAVMAKKTGASNAKCLETKSKTLTGIAWVLINDPEQCLTEEEINHLYDQVQQFCDCKTC